jgi:RHS repeat-associated protein
MTDSSGNVIGEQGHYPFGEQCYAQSTTTKWQFTSYERDAESGNDYATFRYDVNRLGRFASPDLLAGSVADPQSLNRYAYVLNDPVNFVDPLGLRDCPNPTPGGCAIVSNGAGGDSCFTAACQNPGDVLLDGFVTDRGEAEEFVQAGFGFVCPVSDCSGATVVAFNGDSQALRVPNCSDPTVEDCGYSYYLPFGGALGLTGAQPQGPAQPPESPQGPAQPQTRSHLQACLTQAAQARNQELLQGGGEAAGGAGLLAAGAVIAYLAGPAIAAEVTGGGLLGALIGGEEAPRDLSILAVTFGTGVYSVYHGIQTISGGLAQYSQAAAACRSEYGPS